MGSCCRKPASPVAPQEAPSPPLTSPPSPSPSSKESSFYLNYRRRIDPMEVARDRTNALQEQRVAANEYYLDDWFYCVYGAQLGSRKAINDRIWLSFIVISFEYQKCKDYSVTIIIIITIIICNQLISVSFRGIGSLSLLLSLPLLLRGVLKISNFKL